MKLYEAIDLHSNNNVTVLIDEQDQVVYQKRLPNDLPLIVQQLSGIKRISRFRARSDTKRLTQTSAFLSDSTATAAGGNAP
jgi:hypothetical protein